MQKGSRTPTRAEYNRLKADCERLRNEMEMLRQRVLEQSHELTVQFTRIAEIQAVLDEERLNDVRSHTPTHVSAAPFRADGHPLKSQA